MSEQELSTDSLEDLEDISDEYVSPLAADDDSIEEIEEIDDDDVDFEFDDDDEALELDDDTFVSDFKDDDLLMGADGEVIEDFEILEDTKEVTVLFDAENNELVEAPELSADEAQELTEHIRSTTDVLYVLVARAHAGKAHLALGYSTFAAYVKEEFNISRSRAYQFLNQASVIAAIEEATPEGTHFRLSEAAARDLKNYVEELAPEIKERTEGLAPNEAGKVVEEMVSEYRDKLKEDEESDLDDIDFNFDLDEVEYDAPDFGSDEGGGSGGGGSEFDDMAGFDSLDDFSGGSSDGLGLDDPDKFRNRLENVYAFYSALTALEKMPDASEIIDSIQEARRPHINASLPKAKEWLDSMHAAWFTQEEKTDESNSLDDSDLSENTATELDDFLFDDLN